MPALCDSSASALPSQPTLQPTYPPGADKGATYAFLVLRLWLGFRALFAGIEKFADVRNKQIPLLDATGEPDISGATVQVQEKFYAFANYQAVPDALREKLALEPLLPAWLAAPFYATLGWLLVAFGLTLLLGLWTRVSLLAMGLLYTALSLGLILLKQDAGIAWLALHIGLVAYALQLSKFNRFAITRS
jgi:thiosulfate dehydrogenase [quinone] large subunit